MRTAIDAQPDTLDPSERTFVHAIQEHGWYRTEVSNDAEGPGFSYTTGLWFTQQQPELIVFSMNGETAHKVFWSVFNDARNGRALSAKTRTDAMFGNSAAYAFSVAKRHYAQLLGWSRWFYGGDDFPCLQIVWPDVAGLFPWQPSCSSAFSKSQPDLTEKGWLTELAF